MNISLPEEKVVCRTPTPGKTGTTSIPKWKYDCLQSSILDSVGNDGIAFTDLGNAVREHLTEDQLSRLGSLMWHVTSVKLNMEVEGEIERVPGRSPQFLRRSK